MQLLQLTAEYLVYVQDHLNTKRRCVRLSSVVYGAVCSGVVYGAVCSGVVYGAVCSVQWGRVRLCSGVVCGRSTVR
jgi:ABC-type arginine transport system permease subunit